MKIQDVTRRIRSNYRSLITVQNVGLAVVILVAVAWVWGSVSTLQRNYVYQRQVDENEQTIAVMRLQNQNYRYQQEYYKSSEYLELSARAKLNLALPGERVVTLPSSSDIHDTVVAEVTTTILKEESNFNRWLDFFFSSH